MRRETTDIRTATGQPTTLLVGGRPYRFFPLTFRDLGDLQAWVDSQAPDPFAAVNAAIAAGIADPKAPTGRRDYPVAQRQFMIEAAVRAAAAPKPKIGTPAADDLLQTLGGVAEWIFLSIRKGDPAFDRAAAAALFEEMTPGNVRAIQDATGISMVVDDPKAPTIYGNETP